MPIRRISVVSTHSRLKAAGNAQSDSDGNQEVSTHSRLKAAGNHSDLMTALGIGFNTQPPEGGWVS